MKKISVIISGMTCSHCEQVITKELIKIKGIKEVNVSFKTKIASITYDEAIVELKDIKLAVNNAGYKYKGLLENNKKSNKTTFKQFIIIFIIILFLYYLVKLITGFSFNNFVPSIKENTPLVMLFLIGLLTSVHCIGMCGSINLAVLSNGSDKASISRPLLYNLGRIISYTLTGAIVGAIGSVLTFNTALQGTLILVTSIFMFMMGLSMLGWLPHSLHKLLPRLSLNIKSNNNSPLIVGLLNGLMPCGPLQAMQLYALSTGSMLLGALSMFIFSLGTIPLVLGFGILFTKLNTKYHLIVQRISSVLVVLLSIIMLSRAFALLGIDLNIKSTTTNNYNGYAIAEVIDGKQYVSITLTSNGYTPIVVQKGIPVVFDIKVTNVERYGCTSTIKIPIMNITKSLENGDNIIEFTPKQTGNMKYTCWMGMVASNIMVIDDLKDINSSK